MSVYEQEIKNKRPFYSLFFLTQVGTRLNRVRHFTLVFSGLMALFIPFIISAFLPIDLNQNILTAITLIIYFSVLIYTLLLKIGRLRDFNFSAWWLILLLVPYLNILWALLIFIIPGSRSNKYGPRPDKLQKQDYICLLTLLGIMVFGVFLSVAKFQEYIETSPASKAHSTNISDNSASE